VKKKLQFICDHSMHTRGPSYVHVHTGMHINVAVRVAAWRGVVDAHDTHASLVHTT
jgi:hypothetical protein